MKYVGIYSQQVGNNIKSLLLLLCFPLIIVGLVWLFFFILDFLGGYDYANVPGQGMVYIADSHLEFVTYMALQTLPWIAGIVTIWFIIAYFTNTSIIRHATGARPLERRENPRVYNIVENLTMTCGMDMPKVNVIDTPELNAFASGIDRNSYTVTVTTGLCDRLNDKELEGVIAHELTHIRNKDTRLLIVSIIFVGIMAFVLNLTTRMLWNHLIWGGGNRRRDNNGKNGAGVLIAMVIAIALAAIGYLFVLLTRFAISRKREYMADAGGAELCGDPLALASALRKISGNPALANVERQDVAQLFIVRPPYASQGISSMLDGMFSTHPPIEKRIAYLEQF